MARIKGRYVATVAIDFDFDETLRGVVPFEEAKNHVVCGKLTDTIQDIIQDEIVMSIGTVSVAQTYADLYKVDETP